MHTHLLRTAFFTSLATYLGFALLDYAEPGFVSNVFSLHVVALITIVLGIAWARNAKRSVTPKRWYVVLLLLGVVMASVAWREGEVFAAWRLPLCLAVAALPIITMRALSARSD